MRLKRRSAGLIAVLLLFLSSIALGVAGQGKAPLRVALDRAWHPLSYLDDRGRPQGVLIDYWRLIAKKLGRPVEFELVDWQQSLDLVRDGKADVHGGLFESDERDAYLDFSGNLLPLSTRLFVSSKLNARRFKDLENIPVGITKGGYEVEFVKIHFPFIHLKQYNNNAELIESALKGDVLAFVADYPVGMYYLHKYGSPEQFQVVYTLYTNHLKSAVKKGRNALQQEIINALRRISQDEKDNITQKWIRTETVIPAWLISSLIFVAVGLLIAGGFVYTVLLRVQVRRKTEQLQCEVDESVRLRNENLELVEELRKQKEEAEQANNAKTKFLAAASHDLRQPLHALALFTSVLDESIQYPKVRKVVDQINASVNALQNLFNALLDISRLEAGVMKVEMCQFALQSLFEKLSNEFTPQAKAKGLALDWPSCHYSVDSDPALLEQILRNYLSNAIRYTETGNVHVECREEKDAIVISVIDSGVGIPQEEQEAIFTEFYQLANPERDRSKGLGLGLAIVQRTAELLGHRIKIESQIDVGSTFSVALPMASGKKSKETAEYALADENFLENRKTVVVIDDEINVLEATESLLRMWGCDVVTGSDINEVLDKLQQHGGVPDAIIADYRLRDKQTGIDAIKTIYAKFGDDIAAIIVTGDIAAERLREVNKAGLQVLHKPVAPARLRAFLRRI